MIILTQQGTTVEVPAPTPQQVRASYLVTMVGTDGSEWNLNTGPVQLCAGVKLFGTPQVTHWTRTSPAVAGSRWTGLHVEEKNLVLPVEVVGGDWSDYRDSDQAFFRALDPSGEVTINVTSPDAVTKSLVCRFVADGDAEDEFDPLLFARKFYQLTFLAPTPFWSGPVVRQSITFQDPVPFFPGPPFYINPGSASENTTISNPGDVPAWPRYTITGPSSGWTVGVGDSQVASAVVPVVGSRILIDSAPGVRTILDSDGVRQYQNMTSVQFAAVPPGRDVPIVATMLGFGDASEIDVELTPLYWRPL